MSSLEVRLLGTDSVYALAPNTALHPTPAQGL